jgi:flagellar hook-associated protein 3 FlgL
MRITETRLIELAGTGVSQSRERAADAAQEVQTGLAVDRPSDDVARWSEGMRANARKAMSEERGGAIGRARAKLDDTDRALGTLTDLVTRANELAVEMANGTMDTASRAAAATEVQGLRAQALVAADTTSADGEYVFAGSLSNAVPFDPATGRYLGDVRARSIETAEGHTTQVSVTGGPLASVFSTLDALSSALTLDDANAVRATLPTLQSAADTISALRTSAGTEAAALDSADSARKDFEVAMTTNHARAVESDPVAAASRLAKAQFSLTSAQSVAQALVQMAQSAFR